VAWEPDGGCALGVCVFGVAGFAVVEWSVPVGGLADPGVPVVDVDPAGGVVLGRGAAPTLPIPAGVKMPSDSLSRELGVRRTGAAVVVEPGADAELAAEEDVGGRGCPETTPPEDVAGCGCPGMTPAEVVAGLEVLGVATPVEATAGFGVTVPGLTGNLLTGAESPPANAGAVFPKFGLDPDVGVGALASVEGIRWATGGAAPGVKSAAGGAEPGV